jgi:hypothetical protein
MGTLKKNELDLWLWDGASEYEGILLKLEEASFAARVRQVRRGGAPLTGTLGKRVPGATLDVHRQFTQRKFLAHVKGTIEGTLFEAEIESVQTSQDGDFEQLIAGRFAALDEKQLELLRKMSVENAATLMQRQAM